MNKLFNGIEKHSALKRVEVYDVSRIGRKPALPIDRSRQSKRAGLDIKRFIAYAALTILSSLAPMTHASSLSATGTNNALSEREIVESVVVRPIGFPKFVTVSNAGLIQRTEMVSLISASPLQPITTTSQADTDVQRKDERKIIKLAAQLHPNTVAALDSDEHERLAVFRGLRKGWDFGRGEPLSAASVLSFDRFFAPGNFAPENPSLFMSSAGNIVVNYDTAYGATVEIEFLPDGLSYYIDSEEEASIVSFRNAGEFRRKIARDIAISDEQQLTG